MSNFNQICELLKVELSEDVKNKPKIFNELLDKLQSKIEEDINLASEELIEYGIRAFEKEIKNDKKDLDENKGQLGSSGDINQKLHDLIASLDKIISKTEFMDLAIEKLNNESNDKLLVYRKDRLEFILTREFKIKSGSNLIDVKWKTNQNKPEFSIISNTDPTLLTMKGNGCYNYYSTDTIFTNENVEMTFSAKYSQNDYYIYFGIYNESTNLNSNCMCCSPNSVTYIKLNGYVYEMGTSIFETKLNSSSSKGEINVKIRLMLSDSKKKEIFFEVNNNGECGPYKITGSRFTFTSGSCNVSSGNIRIESAVLV